MRVPDKRLVIAAALASSSLKLAACGDDAAPSPTQALFDPMIDESGGTPEAWFAFPFPSDHRRDPDGHVRMQGHPGKANIGMYLQHAQENIDGFGTNSPIYVAFNGALDTQSIPAAGSLFAHAGASLQLVDITPGSSEYGRRRPLRWSYWETPGKYVPAHTLAAAPAWGFPMRERTTYAFIVTSEVRGADGPLTQPPLLAALLGGAGAPAADAAALSALGSSYAPLATLLDQEGFDKRQVAAATVFTTQTISAELAAIYEHIQTLPAPPLDEGGWQELGDPGSYFRTASFQWRRLASVDFHVMEGRFSSPNYQHGTFPYLASYDGGGFELVDGIPQPSRTESLRFVLTVPEAPPKDGGACYPLALVAHGTGGDAYSFEEDGTAGRLAARGIAGLGIDQPMHGLRNNGQVFPVELASFNFNNPVAACASFRQSAADSFSVTRFTRESLLVPADKSPTGAEICFDPARVFFFGHSHGGLSGALVAAFERELSGYVLSAGGGGLSITLMERKDYVDFGALMAQIAGLDVDDEPLSEMHPFMGLLQMGVEITDPVNYSPLWLATEPKSILMTSGLHDEATPTRTAEAMAIAGGVPLVEPSVKEIPEYGWAGIQTVAAPLDGNVAAGFTAGFLQWTNDFPVATYDNHFLIFHRPEAINASMRFLQSAAYEGIAKIERDPDADVR